jgi:hypothetical protein
MLIEQRRLVLDHANGSTCRTKPALKGSEATHRVACESDRLAMPITRVRGIRPHAGTFALDFSS